MSFVSRSRYQPGVRLGNWFEDICLEQDKLRTFKDLRDSGDLLVEKARKLYNNFHKEIVLEASQENIRFGAIVQVMPYKMHICDQNTSQVHAALSVIVNEHVVRHRQTISEECELSIAPAAKACIRNAFRIVGSDDSEHADELLKYGQRFRLECVATTNNDPLFLYSAPNSIDLTNVVASTFNSSKHGELNFKVGLCLKSNCGPGKRIPCAYTNWFCQHMDPEQRFETDGLTLPSNQPLIITHAATNRNLAAENVMIPTLFGPEFLVSVQNYKNMYKRETWKNIWMIGNGQ